MVASANHPRITLPHGPSLSPPFLYRNPRQRSIWASLAADEYFDLIFKAHEIYSKLVPYWDPGMLPSFGWHATHRAVRSKVLYRIVDLPSLLEYTRNLRGSKAATLLSLLQEVRRIYLVILLSLSGSGQVLKKIHTAVGIG